MGKKADNPQDPFRESLILRQLGKKSQKRRGKRNTNEHGQSRTNTDKYGQVTIKIGKEQLLDKIHILSYNNNLCRHHKK
jgi:hypothetical protein